MKLEKQTDNTYLASERVGERLKLCEATDPEGAWYGLVEMIDGDFHSRAEELASVYERGAA